MSQDRWGLLGLGSKCTSCDDQTWWEWEAALTPWGMCPSWTASVSPGLDVQLTPGVAGLSQGAMDKAACTATGLSLPNVSINAIKQRDCLCGRNLSALGP